MSLRAIKVGVVATILVGLFAVGVTAGYHWGTHEFATRLCDNAVGYIAEACDKEGW